MDYMTKTASMPIYMIFPRFLLKLDCGELAKITYILLYDRARLSAQNEGWVDESGHVFIYFTLEELAELTGKSKTTLKSVMNTLEDMGLIRRVRQGACKPNRIYVKVTGEGEPETCPTEGQESVPQRAEKLTHGEPETCPTEGRETVQRRDGKLTPNKNKRIRRIEQEQESKRESLKLGSHQNVILSKESYDELRSCIPNLDHYIRQLSNYMASTGRQYADHAETLRLWASRDNAIITPRAYTYQEEDSL